MRAPYSMAAGPGKPVALAGRTGYQGLHDEFASLYPIRPISEDEFDSFEAVDQHAFNGSPLSESDRQGILDRFEFDRSLAAFDGAAPVGVTTIFSFRLSVPGRQVLPAAGVTFVAVLPTYRRRGVLSSLMRRQLVDVRGRGELLAVLWASESVIYGRYGYGLASWFLNFTVQRGEGALAKTAPADDCLRLRIVDPPTVLPELAKVYDAVLPSRPGFYVRDEAWWRRARRGLPGRDQARRAGRSQPGHRPAAGRRPATVGCHVLGPGALVPADLLE